MKKIIKWASVLVLLVILFSILPNNIVNAWDYETQVKAGWTKSGDSSVVTPTENVVGSIIKVIRIVGTGVSVIMISYVAIKYMTAAPDEKAEFKKSATAFIVGAIVLFGATNILTVISDFATKNIS